MKRLIVALLIILFVSAGCAKGPNKATTGALAGSALGAGLGAIVGNQTGHAGAGVAIGAAAGALGGAVFGNSLDAQDVRRDEVRSEIALNEKQIQENQRLINELRRSGADVRDSKRGVVINLPDVLFEFDRANLTHSAKETVGEIAKVLETVKNRNIAIEGHTDSVGTVTYNKKLSVDRANSVARELSANGVSRGQMSVHGYGEGAPIATNNTDSGRARNRRVEVIIEN